MSGVDPQSLEQGPPSLAPTFAGDPTFTPGLTEAPSPSGKALGLASGMGPGQIQVQLGSIFICKSRTVRCTLVTAGGPPAAWGSPLAPGNLSPSSEDPTPGDSGLRGGWGPDGILWGGFSPTLGSSVTFLDRTHVNGVKNSPSLLLL